MDGPPASLPMPYGHTQADPLIHTAIPSNHPGVSIPPMHPCLPRVPLASLTFASLPRLASPPFGPLAHRRRLKHYQPSILLWAGGIGAGVALFAQAIPIFKVCPLFPSLFPGRSHVVGCTEGYLEACSCAQHLLRGYVRLVSVSLRLVGRLMVLRCRQDPGLRQAFLDLGLYSLWCIMPRDR
jgi:hypothetical protein